MSLEERFEDLVDELVGLPGVTPPQPGRGFGAHALKVRGRIFAMFVRGRLVVKLPAARVDELVGAGEGIPFDANKGKPMKEWLNLDPESTVDWSALAKEAMSFVGG
ncbi:MmcQ/YjbR family DNA-binding protein [Amycolatopsis acidicola]|uniref:MmcQ/YjbR family DNA-binding protein n=1 Tax=Amycolatopsis acidicola TaxID=2596893 RepID=A0A5N0VBH9_9PSEU|nr:MmcQ/YjbR family DNA-binding protein [Amycolatopsis acidicola]KAA9162311.1 MmcQ/YjbR family DNA-binding protein [Amycolatopsis acidicola]